MLYQNTSENVNYRNYFEQSNRLGFVNRDVKLEHILFNFDGTMALNDYGLFKKLAGIETKTHRYDARSIWSEQQLKTILLLMVYLFVF